MITDSNHLQTFLSCYVFSPASPACRPCFGFGPDWSNEQKSSAITYVTYDSADRENEGFNDLAQLCQVKPSLYSMKTSFWQISSPLQSLLLVVTACLGSIFHLSCILCVTSDHQYLKCSPFYHSSHQCFGDCQIINIWLISSHND